MKLIEALELALELKAKESRRSTILTYTSFIGIFDRYLRSTKKRAYKLKDFTKKEAMQYLDYVLMKRKVSINKEQLFKGYQRTVLCFG